MTDMTCLNGIFYFLINRREIYRLSDDASTLIKLHEGTLRFSYIKLISFREALYVSSFGFNEVQLARLLIDEDCLIGEDDGIRFPRRSINEFYGHGDVLYGLELPDGVTWRWYALNVDNIGINGMIPIESPRYGSRLFSLANGNTLNELRFDGLSNGLAEDHTLDGDNVFTLTGTERRKPVPALANRIIGPARMATDGRFIVFVHQRQVFAWDMSARNPNGGDSVNNPDGAFIDVVAPTPDNSAATLPDEEWADVVWTDGYFVLAARQGQIFHSLLDTIIFDQLDFSSASSKPDSIVGLAVLNRRIYILGTHTIEQWYNSGGADFAFTRDNSYTTDIGCASRETIQTNEVAVMFLGTDQIVYYIAGNSLGRLSTETVEFDIKRSLVNQARAFVYTEEGHRFYSLTLFFDNEPPKNWTIDLSTKLWHNRTETNIYQALRFRDKNLICSTGRHFIEDYSISHGTAHARPIPREAVTPIMHADQRRIRVFNFQTELFVDDEEVGDDEISLSFSDDSGKSWLPVPKGLPLPMSQKLLRWDNLGQFRFGRNFRVRTNSEAVINMLGAYAELDVDLD